MYPGFWNWHCDFHALLLRGHKGRPPLGEGHGGGHLHGWSPRRQPVSHGPVAGGHLRRAQSLHLRCACMMLKAISPRLLHFAHRVSRRRAVGQPSALCTPLDRQGAGHTPKLYCRVCVHVGVRRDIQPKDCAAPRAWVAIQCQSAQRPLLTV